MVKEKEIEIIALEFPDNVRTRSGMYIGATDSPDVILREAIDNSVDELMGSLSCNRLDVQLKSGQRGGWYVIADNGRGIPIIYDEDKQMTKTQLAVGTLNAGSKFKKGSEDISTGLNGVGVSCTNALSDRFVILSKVTSENFDKSIQFVEAAWNEKRDGELFYVIEFAKGLKVYENTIYRDEVSETYGFEFPEGMSTITAFIPDPIIWKSIVASYNKKSLSYVQVILDRFYHKSCTITIDGVEVNSSFEPYQFEFVKEISITDGERTRAAKFFINFDVDKDMSVNDLTGSINSLIVNRGIHIDWARRSYQEALKRHYNLQHDYTWCGLKMNVICLTANTDFSSQTKERSVKIDNLYIDEVMPELMCEFHNLFHKNEDYFETHVKRLNEYAASLNQISAINKVKQVVGTVDGGNRVRSKLPSSVKDAASNDRSKCELFICFKGDVEMVDCNGVPHRMDGLESELASGKSIYTFSSDHKGSLFPSKVISAGKTGVATQLVKITLDNGKSFECTLDHKFLMRDGTYKEARELVENDSMMPLYLDYVEDDSYDGCKRRVVRCEYDDAYDKFRHVYNTLDENTGLYFWYVYRIMGMHPDVEDWSSGDDIVHLHHIDDSPVDDSPSNLARVDQSWHRSHHGGIGLLARYNAGEFNNFFGCNEAKRESIRRSSIRRWTGEGSDEERKRYSEMAKLQWSNPELRKWKAEDNARWCREHPEEASARAQKAQETIRLNYIYDIKYELEQRSLSLTSLSFDLLGLELYPVKHYTYSTLVESFEEDLAWCTNINYPVSHYYDDLNRIEAVLLEMGRLNLELTKDNFNQVSSDLDWGWYPDDKWDFVLNFHHDTFERYRLKHNNNHKISSIELVDYPDGIDVYCLQVDNELHNFPLAAGIFTHNCEGKSASGTMLKSRDPNIHAILELRGVPLNSINLDLDTIMDNEEMSGIVTAIGAGVNEYFRIENCRYGKIILAADSDIDGERINSMILGFIARKMTFLIDDGRVFIALAPLYQQGDKYVYPGENPKDIIDMSKPFKRYKGLGEINVKEAKEFFFDTNKRKLLKITSSNLPYVFDLLTQSATRKQLMIRKDVIVDKYKVGIL